MNCIVRRILPALLLCVSVLVSVATAQRQESLSLSTRPAITVLDSTKEQDGLFGSVRRVKTETAKIEFKDGRPVEGPAQLVEITTYGIKGNRVENTSYPIGGSLAGKEEYKYDERGNITEMTLRDQRGAIISREAYSYEFDKFGNWTKMVTSLVVFENGELKREPVEVTYRTLTYYFDDYIAKIVEEPRRTEELESIEAPSTNFAPAVPEPAVSEIRATEIPEPTELSTPESSLELAGEPPMVPKLSVKPVESVPTSPTIAVSSDHQLANQLLLMAHAHLKLREDREAIKAFKESIKLNPGVAETYYGLGFVTFRLGRFREAVDAFKKATTLDPNMAKAHYGLGLAYQELNMIKELMDEYRTLERLDQDLARKLRQTFPQFHFPCRLLMGC